MQQDNGEHFINEYYKIAPTIVEKIESSGKQYEIYKKIDEDYIQTCVQLIKEGENESCLKLYKKMVNNVQLYL